MSFHRAHVIVMARTTMSTVRFCSTGIRSAAVMTTSWTLLGSPKIALATCETKSMSNPSICPVRGLRAPSSWVSADTPAMR